jgi:YesN/AraC family two-component response regulator
MIKVVIVDDHLIVREGLKQIITESSDIRVVGEASNGAEALEKVKRVDCDVLLLDISMPGRSGLEILKDLKHESPALSVPA